MAETTIVNYEQILVLIKKFQTEGESIAQLVAKLRQAVHHLKGEWIGDAADTFFDEMEMIVLPSLHRLSEALLFTATTTQDITKIYHSAEDEGSRIFKGDLSSTDFGAGAFAGIGGSGAAGGIGGPGLGETDFGAGEFGSVGAGGGGSPGGGSSLGETDFGAGEFGGIDGAPGSAPAGAGEGAAVGVGEAAGAGSPFDQTAGGGGGGGGPSEGAGGGGSGLDSMGSGIQGDGSSSGSGTGGGGSSAGGGGVGGPAGDHVYQSATGAGGVPTPSNTPAGAAGGAQQPLSLIHI